MKIAVVQYRTQNIGDDIQSLALERLLPRVDLQVDRDWSEAAGSSTAGTLLGPTSTGRRGHERGRCSSVLSLART